MVGVPQLMRERGHSVFGIREGHKNPRLFFCGETGAKAPLPLAAAIFGFALAPYLVGIFNNEPEVLSIGVTMIRVAAIGYPFAGVSIVLSRSIIGAGDTLPPMIFNLVILWLLQVPLAVYLSGRASFGVTGVWWAGVATSLVLAITSSVYFAMGRWKHITVS